MQNVMGAQSPAILLPSYINQQRKHMIVLDAQCRFEIMKSNCLSCPPLLWQCMVTSSDILKRHTWREKDIRCKVIHQARYAFRNSEQA